MQCIARPLRQWVLGNDVRNGLHTSTTFGTLAADPITAGYGRFTDTLISTEDDIQRPRRHVKSQYGRLPGRLSAGRAYSTEKLGPSKSTTDEAGTDGGTEEDDRAPGGSTPISMAARRSIVVPQPDLYSRREPKVTFWRKSFVVANSKAHQKPYEALLAAGHQLPKPPRNSFAADLLISGGTDGATMSRAWSELSPLDRLQNWPGAMLWILYHRRYLLLDALEATYIEPLPPPLEVADLLDCASQYHLAKMVRPRENTRSAQDPMVLNRLLQFTLRFLEREQRPQLRPHTIRLLMTHADADSAKELYRLLCIRHIKMNPLTGFQVVQSLARKHLIGQARHQIRRLVMSGHSKGPYLEIFKSVCTTLLKAAGNVRSGNQGLAVLNEILGYGIEPNVFLYNVSILNALRGQQFRTAWQIYGVLKEHGLQPDVRTFSTLITGAKRLEAWDLLDSITDDMRAYQVKPDGWLATDMLHTCYFYMHKEHQQSAFPTMQKMYETYFSTAILRQAGIIEGAAPDLPLAKPEPTPVAVNHMLWAYLRYCPDWTILAELYARYRTAVAANHEQAFLLTSSAHIPTAFILALGKSRSTLPYCPAVMADMLSPTSGLPKPTVETWNVLVHAYVQHNQLQAAERVLERMQAHGYTPDRVTWTTLLYGYARRQKIADVGRVLKQMYSGGHVADSWTIQALVKVKNRARLAQQLTQVEREIEAERLGGELARLYRRKKERAKRRADYLRKRKAALEKDKALGKARARSSLRSGARRRTVKSSIGDCRRSGTPFGRRKRVRRRVRRSRTAPST